MSQGQVSWIGRLSSKHMKMNLLPCPNQTKFLHDRLQKGKEAAAHLQTLLQKPLGNNNNHHGSSVDDDDSSAAQLLALQILRSFTESLSVLEPINEISRQIVAADVGPTKASSTNRSSKTTTGAVGQRKKKPAGGVKDRRGSYKRRYVADSWMKLSSNMEDEYAWRKYGQKEILNSKFPRCYFRCTHKHDQGCKATKQVQKIDQEPLVYQTTYFGFHTCRTNYMTATVPPAIIHEQGILTDPVEYSSCLLKFEDTSSSTTWLEELMTTKTTTGAGGGSCSGHPAAPPKVRQDCNLDEEEVVKDDVSGGLVYSCSSNNTTSLPDNFDHHHDVEVEAAAAAFRDDQFSDLDNINLYDDFEKGGDQYFLSG